MTKEEISQLCFHSMEWAETPSGHIERFRCVNAPDGHDFWSVHTYVSAIDELCVKYIIDGEEFPSGLPVLNKLSKI